MSNSTYQLTDNFGILTLNQDPLLFGARKLFDVFGEDALLPESVFESSEKGFKIEQIGVVGLNRSYSCCFVGFKHEIFFATAIGSNKQAHLFFIEGVNNGIHQYFCIFFF